MKSPIWTMGACRRQFRVSGCKLLLACLLALLGLFAAPPISNLGINAAFAQGDDRYPWLDRRQRMRVIVPQQQESGYGFPFFGWGGGGRAPTIRVLPDEPERRSRPQPQADFSKAPPPRKPDAEPARSVLVLGDSMADWLGSGLEDAFADGGEFGVIRKARPNSSLVRNEPRDYDWVQGARDASSGERADFIVMMIGLSDRHPIRERQAARPAPPASQPGQTQQPGQPLQIKPETGSKPEGTNKPEGQNSPEGRQTTGQPNVVAPEPERAVPAGPAITHEFRSEKWGELYGKRVDEVIAVLKSKRVPVMWVGLPPIRGNRARAEISYLNELYKSRAEKAGIIYVDVWEGFADDSGDFANYGPDALGQVRRLRSGDGVHFTKYGARKLAHYVDREIRRLMSREGPIALPVPEENKPEVAAPAVPSGPAPRPVAGPVIPLTGSAPAAEALVGARMAEPQASDAVTKVLLRGEPLSPAPGRADNFAWSGPAAGSPDDVLPPAQDAIARPAARTAPRPAAARPGQKQQQRTTPAGPATRQGGSQAATGQPAGQRPLQLR
jgi:uncharacterized protein